MAWRGRIKLGARSFLYGLTVLAQVAACSSSDSDPTSGGSGQGGAVAGHAGAVAAGHGGSGTAGRGAGGTETEAGAAGSDAGASGEDTGSDGDAGSDAGSGGGTGAAAGGGSGSAGLGGGGAAGGGAAGGGASGSGGASGASAGGSSGSGGSGGSTATQTGIAISVRGLPNGVAATATLVGPNGFSRSIELPATVAAVSPGTYTLTPVSKRVPGIRVDSVFDASVASQTITVESGSLSNAAVSYARRPGTGALWMATEIDWSYRFDDAALQAAASADALQPYNAVLGLTPKAPVAPKTGSIDALAFADNGDAWVGTCSPSPTSVDFLPQVVAKFSPDRQGIADAVPDVVLSLPSSLDYACVRALAFDATGNLWVGTAKGVVLQFAKATLASTSTTPAVTIAGLGSLTSIRFDSAGNLFVSTSTNPPDHSDIKRLSASQLTASDAQITPASIINLPSGYDAFGFTFDASGNLWVPLAKQTGATHGQLVRYNANLLTLSFSTAPNITIDTNSKLYATVFDNTGSAWLVAVSTNGTSLYLLAPDQLTQSSTLASYKGFVGATWMMTALTLNPPH